MSKDVYERLRVYLDNLPGGFPSTESGVELKILEKLFTPKEAEMTMCLTAGPEPASVIAGRSGMDESEAAEFLESMARKGLIFRMRAGEDTYYMAAMFVIGIYEFTLNDLDRELAELMDEYIPELTLVPKQVRVVPVGAAVDTTQNVASYDMVRELVKDQSLASVAPCICRKEKGLLGSECSRPLETCLEFGVVAQYYIENGLAREISIEEALGILDRAEESALVLMTNNSVDMMHICCCCSCCCGILRVLSSFERPADEVQATFQASIDPDLCASCGTCIERCQVEAITEREEYMEIDTVRCIGCGLCLSTCSEEAVSLVERTGVEPLPANIIESRRKIARERGLEYNR
jgi:Pyruvate/2-oxoacid:ferredoxin oxidoreductase delta subunit